jgi:serine phosphatase RsbU (regulator of sigma subunit)
MSRVTLGALIRKRRDVASVVSALVRGIDGGLAIEDVDGEVLIGERNGGSRSVVTIDGEPLGWVRGGAQAEAVAALLAHLAAEEAERKTLANEVLHLYREVNLMYSFSEKLASTLDVETVTALTIAEARHLIVATDGAVLLFDDDASLRPVAVFGDVYAKALPDGLLASIAASRQGEIINDVRADGRYDSDGHHVASLICTPLRVKERVTGLIALSSSVPVTYTAADLKLLNTLALQTASAVENARLFARTVQAARDRERLAALHKELEVAGQIQRAIVPSEYPAFPGRADFDVRASMAPARMVGGDFYDYFLIDQDRLGFVIGDVSGKGVPSALFMAVCRTLIKATARDVASPEACLERVNRVLASEGVPSMYVTVFYGVLDTRTGDVVFCNAGHNPPCVLRGDGSVEPLAQTGGMVLGLFENAVYEAGHVVLGSGDGLFAYTDGVTEASNLAEEEFTLGRLQRCLARCGGLGLDAVIRTVGEEIAAFVGGAPQADDITMLALRYLAPAGPARRLEP